MLGEHLAVDWSIRHGVLCRLQLPQAILMGEVPSELLDASRVQGSQAPTDRLGGEDKNVPLEVQEARVL